MSSKTDRRESRLKLNTSQPANGPERPPDPQPVAETPAWNGHDVWNLYEAQTKFLLGKCLTVVDAAFADPMQRKAVKDLVRQQFDEQFKHVYELTVGYRMLVASGEQMKPYKVD